MLMLPLSVRSTPPPPSPSLSPESVRASGLARLWALQQLRALVDDGRGKALGFGLGFGLALWLLMPIVVPERLEEPVSGLPDVSAGPPALEPGPSDLNDPTD